MGILVAAAGAALGGIAGGKIAQIGAPAPIGPDTSVPGVTKAVMQPASKNNAQVAIAQVDPTNAINYFETAASQYANYTQQGLGLYAVAMNQAVDSVNSSTQSANEVLSTAGQAGTAATNQYLQMIGLNPISTTKGDAAQLTQIDPTLSGTSSLLNQLDTTTDPDQRAALKAQIDGNLTTSMNQYQPSIQKIQDQITALGARPANNPNNPANGPAVIKGNVGSFGEAFQDVENLQTAEDAQTTLANSQSAYDKQLASLQSQLSTATATSTSYQDQLGQFQNQFNTDYSPTQGSAYTGAQVQQQLGNTPGYQFSLQQGNQAVARSASANGMLNSGNALMASNQYGQNLAQNTYQGYLTNLQSVMAQGTTANSAIANNDVAQGNSLAQIYGNSATAALNAYESIGNNYSTAYQNAGSTAFAAAQANAASQNQYLASQRPTKSGLAQQAVASAPGLLAASTAQSQFNYTVAQNQQAGQAFYQQSASDSAGSAGASAGAATAYGNSAANAYYY